MQTVLDSLVIKLSTCLHLLFVFIYPQAKLYPVVKLSEFCSKCKESGTLHQIPVNTKETLIIEMKKVSTLYFYLYFFLLFEHMYI